ncbi:MAG: alpha/beta fold hydrolase, partial [Elusimicrobia bacterium]|nr:alpha/beta fold hydrolase [Elusimicrobiota bacterium]
MPLSPLLEPAVRALKAAEALAQGPRNAKLARSPRRFVSKDGRTSLYRYAAKGRRTGPPVLIVYALINRPTVLDLLPGRSVVEVLLKAGLDVWLLDWGFPGPEAADEGLEAHVLGYLDRAVDAVRRGTRAPKVSLFGYCMGGTLSTMYAALEPEKVARLLVAVTPIRGRQDEGLIHFASTPGLFEPGLMTLQGNVQPEALNAGFALLRPVENLWGKYVRYFERAEDPEFTELFFAMERWVSEGAPLPGRLYREFVKGVYQDDGLMKDGVAVGRRRARAAGVRCPLLAVTSTNDHLVPPSSTKALVELAGSKEKRLLEFPGG